MFLSSNKILKQFLNNILTLSAFLQDVLGVILCGMFLDGIFRLLLNNKVTNQMSI